MTRQRAVRLTATRAALIGDAAHVYPPIGAQGLNLGLRDVEDLLGVISARAKKAGTSGRSQRSWHTSRRARWTSPNA